ncbi:MAG: NAD+ synthase [Dehalococcoidia bacterium]|nr:NAD+ synthase [Dehalococcoidia bacterium]
MPRGFRLALAQMNPTVGDLEGNTKKVLGFVRQARELGADLVAFPELVLTGYPPEDLLLRPAFLRDNQRAMEQVVAESQGIAVVVGFVDRRGHETHNAAAVAYDGKLAGVYHKVFLPNYGVFDEDRYFKPGRTCPVFTVSSVRVGVNICEDIWYAVGPTAVQREAGAELIVNINGSPYHRGKGRFREQMVGTRAGDNGVFIGYVNMVGGQDELVFDGASMVVSPSGELLARAAQFQEELLVADLDVEGVFRQRLRDPRPRKEPPGALDAVGKAVHILVSERMAGDGRRRAPVPRRMAETFDPVGEVYHALVLGTRDYVRKNGFHKVLIGLSGGVDSSLTCCIAVDALGKENVVGVSMPSRYSSEGSVLDARALAENLGIEEWTVPIEPAHRAFEEMLAPSFQGLPVGVAEENVQARVRGIILMTLSNKFGWLVLSTSNKSESAMGYSTLYGDMAGGFAVIKDVPKTLVYELARWRNAHGTPENAVLRSTLEKPASAELRPGQETEKDLAPFAVLDPILHAYVEEERAVDELLAMGFDAALVRRVVRGVDRSEYKRRQAAPGVRITPRNFGKDRRMPIVNGYREA